MFNNTDPITPKIIGENLDADPINEVRFTPIQDNAKSATAKIRNKLPKICNSEKLFYFVFILTLLIFFLLLLLFVMRLI